MQALLATTAARVRRAWLIAIAHLRDANLVDALATRLHTGSPILGLADAGAALAAGEHAAYLHAGGVVARDLFAPTVRKKLPVFDGADPMAVQWAERNRLDKIREISDQTRMLIRDALMSGAADGENPRVSAREIRESIGLTAKQQGIVANYRRQLEQGELAKARARELVDGRSDATIAAAMRHNRPISPERIDAMVDAYRKRWIAYRAETIARTEGLRVAHQASAELYRQAIARDDLRAEDLEGTWIHSPRRLNKSHERAFHRVMHGQRRRWGEAFTTGLGNQLRHPGDPEASIEETADCACVVTWRIRRAA